MKKYIITITLLSFHCIAFSQNLSISGEVKDVNGTAICDALVKLIDDNDNLVAIVITDETGGFEYENLLEGANYTLKVEKAGEIINGVSTFDLVLINKHIMGEELITDPLALYVADIDSSQSVSVVDLIIIRQYILRIATNSAVPSWQFFSSDAVIQDSNNPWISSDIQTRRFNNLTASVVGADFVGYKTADINSSVNPCED
ncbi:MAG: hypothetical protein AAF849_23335 [Bacteroidota bacterium]